MQHEEFVEAAMLDAPALALDVAVAHVDLRRLGEARELLVGRLRGDDAGRVGVELREPHGEAAGIERVELHEARPCLVEQDVVAQVADLLDDALGVVDRAVIGALLDHRDAERPLAPPRLLVGDERMGADLLADALLVERLGVDRADQPVGVAVGLEKDRNAAADEQRAMMRRLVVVAVEQDEVALPDQRRQHDLVRRRGAVEDEIGLLGAEDRGGLLLRPERRTLVHQEVAELEHGVVEVVAKHRLAEMIDEDAADRAAVVEHAAIVPGAGPQLVAALAIVDQRAEERGLQGLGVLLEPAHEIGGDELRRLLGEEDITVDVVEHLDRNVLEALAAHQEHDRHFEAAPAHQVDQRRGLAFEALLAPVDHHAADRGIGLHRDLGILDPARPHHLEALLLDGDDDLAEPDALEVLGFEGRRANEKREPPVKIHSLRLGFRDSATRWSRSKRGGKHEDRMTGWRRALRHGAIAASFRQRRRLRLRSARRSPGGTPLDGIGHQVITLRSSPAPDIWSSALDWGRSDGARGMQHQARRKHE